MQKSGLQHGQGGRAERLQGVSGASSTSTCLWIRLDDEAAARLRLRGNGRPAVRGRGHRRPGRQGHRQPRRQGAVRDAKARRGRTRCRPWIREPRAARTADHHRAGRRPPGYYGGGGAARGRSPDRRRRDHPTRGRGRGRAPAPAPAPVSSRSRKVRRAAAEFAPSRVLYHSEVKLMALADHTRKRTRASAPRGAEFWFSAVSAAFSSERSCRLPLLAHVIRRTLRRRRARPVVRTRNSPWRRRVQQQRRLGAADVRVG